jgi:hypothetical protein
VADFREVAWLDMDGNMHVITMPRPSSSLHFLYSIRMGKGMQAQVCRCGEREREREFGSTHTCMDIWHGRLTLFHSGTRQKREMRREESMAGQILVYAMVNFM